MSRKSFQNFRQPCWMKLILCQQRSSSVICPPVLQSLSFFHHVILLAQFFFTWYSYTLFPMHFLYPNSLCCAGCTSTGGPTRSCRGLALKRRRGSRPAAPRCRGFPPCRGSLPAAPRCRGFPPSHRAEDSYEQPRDADDSHQQPQDPEDLPTEDAEDSQQVCQFPEHWLSEDSQDAEDY